MDREQTVVLRIFSAALLFLFAAHVLNYFNLPLVYAVAPAPVFVMFVYGLHSLRVITSSKDYVKRYSQTLALTVEVATVYVLVNVLSRVVLGLSAPPVKTDAIFPVLLGIQIGAGVSFFYLMEKASHAIESVKEKTVFKNLPLAGVLFRKTAIYVMALVIVWIFATHLVASYLGSDVQAFRVMAAAGAVMTTVTFLLSRKEMMICRGRLSEHNRVAAEKLYKGVALLTIASIAYGAQEVLYTRASGGTIALLVDALAISILLAAVSIVYMVLRSFRAVVMEVVAGNGHSVRVVE